MSDLKDLYQEVILDHSKAPRNFGALNGQAQKAEGYNPLCGDKLTLYVILADDRVKDARFEGSGCAISTASASLMTEAVKGKTVSEVENLFENFHHLVTGTGETDGGRLGKLAVFSGVREFPMRVKCATLAWHTLKAACRHQEETVTTE